MPAPKRQEEEMERRGWIPVRVAAERARCSIGKVYRAIKTDKLKSELVCDRLYVSIDSFRSWAGLLAEPEPT